MTERPARRRLTPAEADRLLEGRGHRRDLRAVLDAAAAPGRDRELRGEDVARAAFAAAAFSDEPVVRRRPRLVGVRTILATLVVAGTASGGVAIAANDHATAPAPVAPETGPGPGSGHPAAVVGEARAEAARVPHRDSDTPLTGAGVVAQCCDPPAPPTSTPRTPPAQAGSPQAGATPVPTPAVEDATGGSASDGLQGQTRRAETPAGPKRANPIGDEDR